MNSNTSRTAWGFDNMLCRRSDDETHPDNDVKHDNKNDLCDNSEHQTCGPREVRLKHGEILDRRQCSRPQGSLRSQHSALPSPLPLSLLFGPPIRFAAEIFILTSGAPKFRMHLVTLGKNCPPAIA
jgi:hypothetical protein